MAKPKNDRSKRANLRMRNGDAELIRSLVTALEKSKNGKTGTDHSESGDQDSIVIIQPSRQGIVLYCPNKEVACANLKKLSIGGPKHIEVCEQIHERVSQAVVKNSRDDPEGLRKLKETLRKRIKTVIGDEPEKSYKKKLRNGREYWYEVWWDPITKKKKDKYIGTAPPSSYKTNDEHAG